MKTKTVAILGTLVGVVMIGATLFGQYVSAYNYGNKTEKTIAATYENNENILAQYSTKVSEAVQIPKMKTKDLVEVTTAAMQGRYGEDGSKAVFQWIQENYPGQVTDALYVNLQQMIEAGRNKFENGQTKLIDQKRGYETALGSFWQGLWLGFAGYPQIDLNDYAIISSNHAQAAFETKIDNGLNLLQ